MQKNLVQIRQHLLAIMLEAHQGRVDNSNGKEKEILKQISDAAENLSLQIEQLQKQIKTDMMVLRK